MRQTIKLPTIKTLVTARKKYQEYVTKTICGMQTLKYLLSCP